MNRTYTQPITRLFNQIISKASELRLLTSDFRLRLLTLILLTSSLGLLTSVQAQTNGPLTLSSANTTGNYSSNVSVTLSSGFSSGATFSASIQPIDCIPLTTTPTLTQNYIITNSPRIAGFSSETQLTGQGTCTLNQGIQYADGLGRPIQSIQVMASPLGNDIIAPQVYDQYGREITKYLPYAPATGTPGSFRPNAVSSDQGAFYTNPPIGVTSMANPYAQTNFDNSPLNRPVESGAPGAAWQLSTSGVTGSGHTVKMVYTLNNATAFSADSVNGRQAAMYYTVINSDTSQTLVANGYYPANALTVTISKDENWQSGRAGTVEEYKDIDGHVVLKRVYNYTGGAVQVLSTYYVYDDLGRLAFVLPPLSGADGAGTISATTLNNLCYQYQYDGLGRAVQKKIPGKGWEYTVYNTMDQPVATQDANQRANNQWVFTKYDAQQRVVMTGIWNNGGTNGTAISRANLQNILTGITTNLYEASITTGNGYTIVAWPKTNITATLSLNYYDNYTNAPGLPAAYSAPAGANLGTRGELTANLTAVLNTPPNMLWKVNYYDSWGRSMEAYAQHYLGGVLNSGNYDAITTSYNFTNAPTLVTRKHWNTASATYPLVTIANTYIYDHTGRKLKSWEQITNGNSSPTTKTLLSQISYNELGQVVNKQLHSTDSVNFYQNIAYTYNERGWLTSSSAPLFAMQLYYNTGINKQYNGNIAYQYWGTPGSLSNNYTYSYDKLNRLTGGTSVDNNNETGIAYDVMGNITALNRYQGGTLIDQLNYTYTNAGNATNQLQSINDATTNTAGLKPGTSSFTYDGNGNLITDPTKGASGISIAYNLLNLPQSVTGSKTITYTYDATGNKLRRVSTGTGNTDYIGGIQYDAGTLSFIQTEEGKAIPNGTTYNYEYYLGDNLGNTRETFDTGTGVAVSRQTDDYYPFGMEISRGTITSPKNEYLYNKKELQEELSQYDYGARFYDPVIARWNTVDPLAEIYTRWSPYHYVKDNPIKFTDPDGMNVIYNPDGSVTYNNEGGSNDATNYAWGLKIAGQTTKKGKDKVRAEAKEASAWQDLTKDKLISFFKKYGLKGGTLQNLVGRVFEQAFHEFMQENSPYYYANSTEFPTNIGGRRGVVPDGIGAAKVGIISDDPILLDGEFLPDASWYEVKATSSTISASSFDYQALALADALYRQDPISAKEGLLSLTFVTTADARISASFVNMVKSIYNINIWQFRSIFRITSTGVEVSFYDPDHVIPSFRDDLTRAHVQLDVIP